MSCGIACTRSYSVAVLLQPKQVRSNATATWLSDTEGCLQSSWFGSTVYVVVTVIRPEGRENTQSHHWASPEEDMEAASPVDWEKANETLPVGEQTVSQHPSFARQMISQPHRKPPHGGEGGHIPGQSHPLCILGVSSPQKIWGLVGTLVASHTSLFSYKFELSNLLIKTIYVSMCVCTRVLWKHILTLLRKWMNTVFTLLWHQKCFT